MAGCERAPGSLTATRIRLISFMLLGIGRGDAKHEAGAVGLIGLIVGVAFMGFGNRVYDRKAKTGARLLSREERLAKTRFHVGLDAGPVIADKKFDKRTILGGAHPN